MLTHFPFLTAHHDLRLVRPATTFAVARCSAYVAVIHFNDAGKCVFLASSSHRTANSVQKIPRRLIADAQRAVHDRPCCDGGQVSAGAALERVSPANRVVFRTDAFSEIIAVFLISHISDFYKFLRSAA